MSCDTTYTLKLKHKKSEKLNDALESFQALMASESVETLKKTKTTVTLSIFRNESRRQDNVLEYVVRVAWDFPGLEIKYESKNEYSQFEDEEIFIKQESKDCLDALIDAAEKDPESQLKLGLMYLQDESSTLGLNDCSQPEPTDSDQGMEWLHKAADNGLAKAHQELARLYLRGRYEDKPAGLAHALVAHKLNENEENEKLIKSISTSMNKKDKGKAKQLAEGIAGKIDDSAVVATRSPKEVVGKKKWLIIHDDLPTFKKLMESKDYLNAIKDESGYAFYMTPLRIFDRAIKYGSYKIATWICDLGFFSPICCQGGNYDANPRWDEVIKLVNWEYRHGLSTVKDQWEYKEYKPTGDKNKYYQVMVEANIKAFDKFLSHVLDNHDSVPHCVNWDRNGAEETLEAARNKKMNKTVRVLKKLLEGKK